jgi:nudix-type nucleoside diphosphatase (YffH/AdpP family)
VSIWIPDIACLILKLHDNAVYDLTLRKEDKTCNQNVQMCASLTSEILSDNWYILKKYTFDHQRRDGEWQRQSREVYDRGNGATILLYNRDKKTVILTRQFRFPVFINGHEGSDRGCCGLLDNMDPESRIKAEAEEETGFKVSSVQKILKPI